MPRLLLIVAFVIIAITAQASSVQAQILLPYVVVSQPPFLQDGLYEYNDGLTHIYFYVTANGRAVDYGGFSITQYGDPYCKKAQRNYVNGTVFRLKQFELETRNRDGTPGSSLTCGIATARSAACEVYDYAARSAFASGSCGHAAATVRWVAD